MKKILLTFVLSLFVSTQAFAQALWTEGKHYEIISDTATEKKEVLEFFSYWCPACYNFEPIVADMKSKLDDDVTFKKVHVNFMGFASREVQDEATTAMMIARALNKEEALNAAIFKNIHVQRAPVTGLKDLTNLFIVNGVEPATVEKAAKSFGVNSQLKKNNAMINQYRRHLGGVPNFIVNGKYQVKLRGSGMTPDDIVNLVLWLSTQK